MNDTRDTANSQRIEFQKEQPPSSMDGVFLASADLDIIIAGNDSVSTDHLHM